MENNKTILIVIGLIIIIGVGYFAFSNTPPQSEINGGETATTGEESQTDKTTTTEEDDLKEPGITEQVNIKEDGFDKNLVTAKEGDFGIMNKSGKTVILVGDKFFENGKEIKKGGGVGLPVENFSSQGIEEMSFWLESNPDDKLRINFE